jgi:hypothetical protein
MVTSKKDAEEVQCGRIWGLIGFSFLIFLGLLYSGSGFLNWQTAPEIHGLVEGFPVFGTQPKRVCSISYSLDGLFQLSCTGVPTVNGHVEPARK